MITEVRGQGLQRLYFNNDKETKKKKLKIEKDISSYLV